MKPRRAVARAHVGEIDPVYLAGRGYIALVDEAIELRDEAGGTALGPAAGAFAAEEIDKLCASLDLLQAPGSVRAMAEVASAAVECLRRGGKIMFCGNGGSAADAQHMAAQLVGRQNYDRAPAAGVALTADTSALTAIANDYGFEHIFARQVRAIGRAGDVLVGISTSGRSPDVVAAIEEARRCRITTVAMTGSQPRDMACADMVLAMPAIETPKIQELHLVTGHIVLALVEMAMFPRRSGPPWPRLADRAENNWA